MTTIYHQIGIKTSLDNAFNAVATLEGISSWWTPTTGDPGINGSLSFNFGEHNVVADVTQFKPNQSIEWTVRGEEGEWLNTHICFNFEASGEQILINFEHNNWNEATTMCSLCSTKWAVFLLSLKEFLETGTGKPYPHDVQINHF